MGRELGAVDSYGDLAVMGGVDDLVDRRQPSGDVRSAGDGKQARLGGPVQFIRDIAGCEGPVGSALDVAARGYARPRQEIGVVFDDGGDDNVVGTQAKAVGEVVDGFGCISADDRDVVTIFASREREAAPRALSYASVANWDL